MRLAETLKTLLKERKMTLNQLAKVSGVKQPTLFGWTQGRSAHNLNDLKRVCDVLEVSMHYLCFGEPDPHEGQGAEILEEIFSGDVRVTLHRIKRGGNRKKRES